MNFSYASPWVAYLRPGALAAELSIFAYWALLVPGGLRFSIEKQFGAVHVSLRMRGKTWETGGHEYDSTDVYVRMPDQGLAGVSLASEGAWCDFTCLSVCGGRART